MSNQKTDKLQPNERDIRIVLILLVFHFVQFDLISIYLCSSSYFLLRCAWFFSPRFFFLEQYSFLIINLICSSLYKLKTVELMEKMVMPPEFCWSMLEGNECTFKNFMELRDKIEWESSRRLSKPSRQIENIKKFNYSQTYYGEINWQFVSKEWMNFGISVWWEKKASIWCEIERERERGSEHGKAKEKNHWKNFDSISCLLAVYLVLCHSGLCVCMYELLFAYATRKTHRERTLKTRNEFRFANFGVFENLIQSNLQHIDATQWCHFRRRYSQIERVHQHFSKGMTITTTT